MEEGQIGKKANQYDHKHWQVLTYSWSASRLIQFLWYYFNLTLKRNLMLTGQSIKSYVVTKLAENKQPSSFVSCIKSATRLVF